MQAVVATFAKYAPGTRYQRVKKLRHLLANLIQAGAPDFRLTLPKPHAPNPRERIATPQELEAILKTADPRMRCFLLLCIQLGLRWAEACRVAPKNYDAEKHTITLRTKGGKARTMPVPPMVEALFGIAAPQPEESGTPYVGLLSPRRKITNSGMRNAYKQHRERCGIARDLNPHDFRRTLATKIYRETHDLQAAQQVLGHKSIATTAMYLAPWADDHIKQILEAHAPSRWLQ